MTRNQMAYVCGRWDGEAGRLPVDDRFGKCSERKNYRRGYTLSRWLSSVAKA